MSRAARFTGAFGDGKHDFQLNIAELEELQELTDAGPEEVFLRVTEGRWRVADIRETLRLGLKGGGMEPLRARAMIDRYAAAGALASHKSLVSAILAAAMLGAPDEDHPSGETEGESGRSPDESSGSQTSTRSAAPSGSRRRKSAAARSGN
nr:gene transfer agent family protein [Brevundimonas diminuta]